MQKTERNAWIAFPLIVLLGALIAWAGSQGGALAAGVPVFALGVALAYVIQWLAFIPAFLRQTERYFDITGGLTYITVVSMALALSPGVDARAWLVWALVVLWATRLGTFLFGRIRAVGKDGRFDALKPSFVLFLNVWTLQGLWVTFTLAAALVTLTTATRKELDAFALVGALIWAGGFVCEVAADEQKRRFNANPQNKGRFIQSGLWARSRHPNYFGEIVVWVGIALIAVPVLQGWQWIALSSPVCVTLLLTRVSGVPLLEQRADAKWGGQAEYEAYKRRTPVLIPRW